MHAFSLREGASLWQQAALRNRQLTAPALLDQTVVVGDYDGYIHFLTRDDGHLLARFSVGGGAIVSPLQSTAEGVLVQTGNGYLTLVGIS
jgi:outer membrane protein assembly factor BamB